MSSEKMKFDDSEYDFIGHNMPNVINCAPTNDKYQLFWLNEDGRLKGEFTFYQNLLDDNSIIFNKNGSFHKNETDKEGCDNKTITQLIEQKRAFFFKHQEIPFEKTITKLSNINKNDVCTINCKEDLHVAKAFLEYPIYSYCQKCNPKCKNCTANPDECTECEDGYYIATPEINEEDQEDCVDESEDDDDEEEEEDSSAQSSSGLGNRARLRILTHEMPCVKPPNTCLKCDDVCRTCVTTALTCTSCRNRNELED